MGLVFARRSTDFAHCKALLSLVYYFRYFSSPASTFAPNRASFVVANEQRLPAKDDGRAALRHRLRIKILLTAESEFHFKVEFNYIRACLPAPFLPVSLFLPVASRFALSPLHSRSFLFLFFLFLSR